MHQGKDHCLTIDVLKESISLDKEIPKEGSKEHVDSIVVGVDFHGLGRMVKVFFDDLDFGRCRHLFVVKKLSPRHFIFDFITKTWRN